MKKGFTLAELLITLGIIGVVAAISLPTLVKLRPNETKGKFLKAHNVIVNMTGDIITDPSLYMTEFDSSGEVNCTGLGCNKIPDYIDNEEAAELIDTNYTGAKYGSLLALRLDISKDDVTVDSNKVTFTTTDGMSWEVSSTAGTVNANGRDLKTETNEIIVDTNGPNEGKNCIYSNTCKNPDQFKFKVDTYGNVTSEDTMGQDYLKDSSNMRN